MPLTPIPLNQPPKDVIVALINRDNSTSLTLAQIDLETVVAMPDNFARNTSVKVVDVPGGMIADSEKIVYYNRLDLGYQWRNTVPVAQFDNPNSTHDLLDSINDIYGIMLTPDDVIDNPYTGNPHVVVARPTSYVWLGQVAFHVVPTPAQDGIPLPEEFQYASPPGFVYNEHYDYAHAPQALMYTMLSEMTQTAHPYNLGHFTISAPIATVGNTASVTLTAVPGSGFLDTHTLSYNRLHVDQLVTGDTLSISYFTDLGYNEGDTLQIQDVVDYLNNRFGLLLDTDDITISTAALVEDNTITVSATPDNYLMVGLITLTMQVGDAPGLVGVLGMDGAPLLNMDGSIQLPFDHIL